MVYLFSGYVVQHEAFPRAQATTVLQEHSTVQHDFVEQNYNAAELVVVPNYPQFLHNTELQREKQQRKLSSKIKDCSISCFANVPRLNFCFFLCLALFCFSCVFVAPLLVCWCVTVSLIVVIAFLDNARRMLVTTNNTTKRIEPGYSLTGKSDYVNDPEKKKEASRVFYEANSIRKKCRKEADPEKKHQQERARYEADPEKKGEQERA